MLHLSNIHKKYGAHTVLQFNEWGVGQGIHWLKGGNGTGKTTLFRIISGLTPFEGSVILNAVALKKEPTLFRSMVSYAEAEPSYPSFITGNELLNFYKDVRKANQIEVDELAQRFGIAPYLDQKIGGYSSGMLKKLSLICAFIGDVALYILDEPLITIDAASANRLYDLIHTKATAGKSFLLSSHQEIDAAQLKVQSVFEIQDAQLQPC